MNAENIKKRFFYRCDSLFAGMQAKVVKLLESEATEKHYAAGKVIFSEGSNPAGVYFIKQGKVKIFQRNQDGKRQIAYIYISGEYFGFRPILSNSSHPATAEAMEPCDIVFYPKSAFQSALSASQVLANNLLQVLSYEFNVWVNLMTAFSQKVVKARVALAILILNEKFRERESNDAVWITIKREDLASYAGTTKETCVRMLTQFKNAGWLSIEGRHIRILNAIELHKIAD